MGIFSEQIIKFSLKILGLFLLGGAFLLLAPKADAINLNTINGDVLNNSRPVALTGSDTFARVVYVTQGGQLVYVRCLEEICTSSTRTVLDGGSGGSINNGNVAAAKDSAGNIHIYHIYTVPGSPPTNYLRYNWCTVGDVCTNTSTSLMQFPANDIFSAYALDLTFNGQSEPRFVVSGVNNGLNGFTRYYQCIVFSNPACPQVNGGFAAGVSVVAQNNTIVTGASLAVSGASHVIATHRRLGSGPYSYIYGIHRCSITCTTGTNWSTQNVAISSLTTATLGTTDVVFDSSNIPVAAFSSIRNGVTSTRFVDCADLQCTVATRVNTDFADAALPNLLRRTDNNIRLFYKDINSPTSIKWLQCSTTTCAGAPVNLIEGNDSDYPTAFLFGPSTQPGVVYYRNYGGSDMRLACGFDGPACPSPDLVILNETGGSSPAITHPLSVNVNVTADFTFVIRNNGPASSSATTLRVDASGSSLNDPEYFAIPALASGATSPVQTFSARWGSIGIKTVTFTSDYYSDVTEGDEANNIINTNINVTTPGASDYSITINPNLRTVQQGKKATYTVTVAHVSGSLPYAVSLTTNNLSTYGIGLSLSEGIAELDPSNTSRQITLEAFTASNTPLSPPNPYTITVTGDNGGGVIKNANTRVGVLKAIPGSWAGVGEGNLGAKGDVVFSGPVAKATFESNSDDGTYIGGQPLCIAIECNKVTTGTWNGSNTGSASGYVRFDTSSLANKEIISAKLIMTYKNRYIGSGIAPTEQIVLRQDTPADCCDLEVTEVSFPISQITALPADSLHIITGLSPSWVQQSSNAPGGWTRYVFRSGLSPQIGSSAWYNYYEREDGAAFSPKLEVEYLLDANVDEMALVQGTASGFRSAKGWLIENYSNLEEDSKLYSEQNPDSYYNYLWNKFGAGKATTLPGSGTSSICTNPTDSRANGHPNFGYTSYDFISYGAGTNGQGNAGNCVVANPRMFDTNLSYTGTRIDNGVFVFNGDLTWGVANHGNCPGGATGVAGSGCNNYSYPIVNGNPTVIFVTGNLFIARPIRVDMASNKRFIFIVRNDSNDDGQVDTDDAIQVEPEVAADYGTSVYSNSITAMMVTDGAFNSFSWLNSRNQLRYDRLMRIEEQVNNYKLITGYYPQSHSTDSSNSCNNQSVEGSSWGVSCGSTGLAYNLGAGLGAGFAPAISGYTGIDINNLSGAWGTNLKDPSNGTPIASKGSLPQYQRRRFALRYQSYNSSGSNPTAYALFFSYEDNLSHDRWSNESDPELHWCGGDYNHPNANNYLNSSGWVGAVWPRIPGEGAYCYVEELVVRGGLYAQGGVKLNRDLRDDNGSQYDSAVIVSGSANPHPPTPGEKFIFDPSMLWFFAREMTNNRSLLGVEQKKTQEVKP